MCVHGRLIDDRYEACEQLALYQDLVHHFEEARDSGVLQAFELLEQCDILVEYASDLQKMNIAQEVFIDLSCQLIRLQERN
jgi:hypothetical protein